MGRGNKLKKAAMLILILAGVAFPFTLPNLFGQKAPQPDATNLTLYAPVTGATIFSNNMAFVSRHAEAEIRKGDVQVFLQNLTTAASLETISVRDDQGAIKEIQQYSRPVTTTESKTRHLTFEEMLNKSTGKEITVVTKSGAKTATLRWYDTERIGIEADKGTSLIRIADIEEITTPIREYSKTEENNVTTTESGLRFSETSNAAGKHRIEAKYLAQGVSWGANYKYYVDEEKDKGSGILQGWAKITNNLEDWENIGLQVVVGYPRTIDYNPPIAYPMYNSRYKLEAQEMDYAGGAPSIAPQFASAPVSEYYVYELKNAVSIKKGEEREFPLFERTIDYEREYSWDTSWEKPRKIYKLTNDNKESWAAGALRVYLGRDLLGEDQVTYTPTGKKAEAYVADVPDVTAKKTAMSTETEQAGRTRITTYRMNITVENRKTERIELKITDTMVGGDKIELIDTSVPASRTGNQLEWKIPLAKGQGREILYTYKVTNQYYY